jgi:hypothetical protein
LWLFTLTGGVYTFQSLQCGAGVIPTVARLLVTGRGWGFLRLQPFFGFADLGLESFELFALDGYALLPARSAMVSSYWDESSKLEARS